ncbi:MAG: signal recognition particle subunit SRP19/SEC65 family protein [Candidatus Thermoplasmatota archaeon]
MVSKDDNKIVLWPLYFDVSLSRSEGRRVKMQHKSDKYPSVDDIANVARSLGLHPIVDKNAMHPSRAWRKEGRVLVDKKGSKQHILVEIAKKL